MTTTTRAWWLVAAGLLGTLGAGCAVGTTDGQKPSGSTTASSVILENDASSFEELRQTADGDTLHLIVRFTPTTTLYWLSSVREGVVVLEGTESVDRPEKLAPGFNDYYAPLQAGTPLFDAVTQLQADLLAMGVTPRPDAHALGTPLYAAGWMTAQVLGLIPDVAPPASTVQSPAALDAWIAAHGDELRARAWPVPEVASVDEAAELGRHARPMSYISGNYGSCGGFFGLDYCCGPLNCRDGKTTNQGPCVLGYCPYNCGTECAGGDLCFWMFGSSLGSTHFTINGKSLPLCGTPYSAGNSWYGGSCPHADAYVFASNGSAQAFINNNKSSEASTKCCNSDPGCQKP